MKVRKTKQKTKKKNNNIELQCANGQLPLGHLTAFRYEHLRNYIRRIPSCEKFSVANRPF